MGFTVIYKAAWTTDNYSNNDSNLFIRSHTQKLLVTTLSTLLMVFCPKSSLVDHFLANINFKEYKFHFIKYKKKKDFIKALLKGFSFE